MREFSFYHFLSFIYGKPTSKIYWKTKINKIHACSAGFQFELHSNFYLDNKNIGGEPRRHFNSSWSLQKVLYFLCAINSIRSFMDSPRDYGSNYLHQKEQVMDFTISCFESMFTDSLRFRSCWLLLQWKLLPRLHLGLEGYL